MKDGRPQWLPRRNKLNLAKPESHLLREVFLDSPLYLPIGAGEHEGALREGNGNVD